MATRRLTVPAEERANKALVSALGTVTKRTHWGIGKNRFNPITGERYMFAHFYGTRSIGNDAWYPSRFVPEAKWQDIRFLLYPCVAWWWFYHAAQAVSRDPTTILHPFAHNFARIDGRQPRNYLNFEDGKHRYDNDPSRPKDERVMCHADYDPAEE